MYVAWDAGDAFDDWWCGISDVHADSFGDLDWLVEHGFMPNYEYYGIEGPEYL